MALTNLRPQIRQVFGIIPALPAPSVSKRVEEPDEYLAEM